MRVFLNPFTLIWKRNSSLRFQEVLDSCKWLCFLSRVVHLILFALHPSGMQLDVVQNEAHQSQHWASTDYTADCQQQSACLQLRLQQSHQRRRHNVNNGAENVVGGHGYFCVLSFHIKKCECQDDSCNCPVEKLQASAWAEFGFKQVCPYCCQQPEDSEHYCGVDTQYEKEAVAENEAGDGTNFVEEVDCCGEARGHFSDIGERSPQAAAIVHQWPCNVTEGEGHR